MACGVDFTAVCMWPVGVDFAAVVFVLEPGFEVICFVFGSLLN